MALVARGPVLGERSAGGLLDRADEVGPQPEAARAVARVGPAGLFEHGAAVKTQGKAVEVDDKCSIWIHLGLHEAIRVRAGRPAASELGGNLVGPVAGAAVADLSALRPVPEAASTSDLRADAFSISKSSGGLCPRAKETREHTQQVHSKNSSKCQLSPGSRSTCMHGSR